MSCMVGACQIMARLDAATIPVDAPTILVHLPFHITADALPTSPSHCHGMLRSESKHHSRGAGKQSRYKSPYLMQHLIEEGLRCTCKTVSTLH